MTSTARRRSSSSSLDPDGLDALIDEARRIGVHLIVASITTENEVSIGLHASRGFEPVGTFREAGFKWGRRLDTQWMQLVLTDVRPEDHP